ncbi:MAG: FHA domain-containing protein [Planctomycetaceae bacterium]
MQDSAPGISRADEEQSPLTVALRIIADGAKPRLVLIDQQDFLIGTGDQCHLRLKNQESPGLHSILRVQNQTVWIEAVDEGTVSVDGHTYRRRALRDGDQLQFDGVRATVQIGERSSRRNSLPVVQGTRTADDLSDLTAEELCDRIEREEAETRHFEHRRHFGWQALMSAVRDVAEQEAILAPHTLPAAQVAAISDERFDELIAHVRELSETLEARTQALAAQESVLIESSSQLCESQGRVSRQLEELLQRIAPEESSGELRASA